MQVAGALLGALLPALACSDPTDPAADCSALISGGWSAPVAAGTLMLDLTYSGQFCLPYPANNVFVGDWRWGSTRGEVWGAIKRLETVDSVRIDFTPLVSACLLPEGGEGLQLIGTLDDGSISGTLAGGYRHLPDPSFDCAEDSDTIIAFDTTVVTMTRGSADGL